MMPAPQESWIAQQVIPAEANVLVAAYPKSHKTNLCIELAVAAASGTPFLGSYAVPRQHRVGVVFMEGSKYRLLQRVRRIAQARSIHDAGCLDEHFFAWFRPKLLLSSPQAMGEMREFVEEFQLDVLILDNWSYIASGNSNDSDEVTPQLMALSALREVSPGLTVVLVHHARKSGGADKSGERLADLIRNSTAFPAWYDVGIAASRKSEADPVVELRMEMRDFPSPAPFAFIVEDEHPASAEYGPYPGGWLQLRVHGQKDHVRAPAVTKDEAAAALEEQVLAFIVRQVGASSRDLRQAISGRNEVVDLAVRSLLKDGKIRRVEGGRGGGYHYFATRGNDPTLL